MKTRLFLLVIFSAFLSILVVAEGTKQIKPFLLAKGELTIDKSRNDFAFYDAAPEFRLNIYISSTTEKIFFGFGKISLPDSTASLAYRIKDPLGNTVWGPDIAPSTSNEGFIDTYEQAVAGPFVSAGGYNPLVYQPITTGNFYIEVYYAPPFGGTYQEGDRYQFRYFDITVVNAAGQPIDGRVWSKAWQFNCGYVEAPPTENIFFGKMYILSDDSIVTRLDCNGFVGGTFSISSNSTGCATTGNAVIDRRSTEGFHTYPQYKVFLNNPDSLIFPTGKRIPGIVPPVTIATDCTTGGVDFGIKTDQDGVAELFIDVNTAVNPDARDVKILTNVLKNPGGTGFNIVHWNGLDNTSTQVPNGTQMECSISFVSGLTHLPIYDIEFNAAGYKVEQIRPNGSLLKIYWDDSQIPGGGSNSVAGCEDPGGCHTWDSVIGNMNTVNSWWFVVRNNLPPIPFSIKKIPGQPGMITGPLSVCRNSYDILYTITPEPSSIDYYWSYSGSGILLTNNGLSATLDYSDSATSGILGIYGRNPDCGDGPLREVSITVNPIPLVTVAPMDTVCYNSQEFALQGGDPPGGLFSIDGNLETTFRPLYETPGPHQITYVYTSTAGCTSSDTTLLVVRNDGECAPVILFPNAFSPNGDGLNESFKPKAFNIFLFFMEIYDRSGCLVFSTKDFREGWDGYCDGKPCYPGVYVFKATYQESLIIDNPITITGTVMLLR